MTKKHDISKHKSANARISDKSSGVFDIVPRSRIRAASTSRPLITGTKPVVNDNTLATAPTLRLKRHAALTLTPLGSKSEHSADAHQTGDPGSSPAPANTPQQEGVSVADLLAKRAEQRESERAAKEDSAPAEASVEHEALYDVSDKVAELGGAEPASDTETSDTPDTPASEVALGKETASNQESSPAAPANSTDTKAPTPGKPEETSKPTDQNIEDDESLARALQSSDQASVQDKAEGHSETLKAAAKDLKDEDGRPHYELYGGKPVIMVHKGSHSNSALMWVVWFFACILLAVIVVDVLLDAGIIETTYQVPYTDFIK